MSDRLPPALREGLRLPAIAAPMFLVSGSALVVAACRAGVIGAFPASNGRTAGDVDRMCTAIAAGRGEDSAPWAVNVITHSTYDRLDAELEVLRHHRPPLVISALGSPGRVTDAVHEYGGVVFADVGTPLHAEKAIAAGADGLVLVTAGAGGHTGQFNGFAFVAAVRESWDGPVVLAGGIGGGGALLAARACGADLAYIGTRLLATAESMAADGYKQMVVESGMADIVLSAGVTGVPANWMRRSLDAAPPRAADVRPIDFSGAIADVKAWRDVWSAGHAVGTVDHIAGVADVVAELDREYRDALAIVNM
jgi:nitronate monooxygenase